jgi:hypothetical protein
MEAISIYKEFGTCPEKKDANLYDPYKGYFDHGFIID